MLRRMDSGESDRRIILLSRDFGKLDLIAKGARKGGSRLASSCEPLVHARFSWATGRARSFVTSVQPITSFPGVRRSYEGLLAGLATAEVLSEVVPLDAPAEGHLQILLAGLTALSEGADSGAAGCWMLARLMDEEGHLPDWGVCQEDGSEEWERPCWVSAAAGGRIHSRHAGRHHDSTSITPEAVVTLRALTDLEQPPRRMKFVSEIAPVLGLFWRAICHRPLPAVRAWEESCLGA